ncbi:unnamed protein product [Bursaphelenchus okinawaensis]|uniref:BTB domain-containing protein n=1 Tax=Bursaphelenchus okinawaensis TaxID=465554 RepID=A0A811JQ69_9BILA|nr:unnamed protein product [Bursaphelenchus okinawaensis]CAG9077669.1 unnamed protein product [Bursaphelenchus okinawaensis]
MTDSIWYSGRSRKVENVEEYISSKRMAVGENFIKDRIKITHYYVDFVGNRPAKQIRLRLITHKKRKQQATPVSWHASVLSATTDEELWSSDYFNVNHKDKEHLTVDIPEAVCQAPIYAKAEFRILNSKKEKKAEPKKRQAEAVMDDPTEKRLKLDFSEYFNKKQYSDVELHCKDKVYYASKLLLSAVSRTFDAMFNMNMAESQTGIVKISEDFEPETLELLLKFIYSGKISNYDMQVDKLVYIAQYYQVKGLDTECIDTLIKTLNPTNIKERTIMAFELANKKFINACSAYTNDHIDEIV